MARRGGRRGRRRSRRRSTRSKASSSRKRSTRRRSTAASKRRKVRSVAKAKRARNTTKSTSSKSKSTGGSRGRSNNTRGGQAKANRNQNKKARRTVRSVKKAVSRAAKGIGKSLRGAAANAAGVQGKQKSKLQRQFSNLKKDIAQKSTKEARFNRRADRLKRQFGLDTRDMRNLKINVNVDQAAKHFGLDTNRFTKGLYGALPKAVRNFRFNTELGGKFRSPHKLGVREGYRAPNRGGQTIAANTRQQLAGLRADPSQDIGMMYQNILGREADQEGLDYWTNEFRSGRQNMDDIRRQLVQSDEFGGRSDADKSSALRGLKQRRAARGEKVGVSRMIEEMNKRGIRHSKTGSPPRRFPDTKIALPYFPDRVPVPGGEDDRPMLIPLPDRRGGRSIAKKRRPVGPQQDWLGSLYSRHNISGGKLDQKARDYWSNEAKTKGRKATARSIIGTAKASGTYGGRKRPRRIDTGRTPRAVPLPWFGGRGPKTGKPRKGKGRRGLLSAAAGLAGGLGLRGGVG